MICHKVADLGLAGKLGEWVHDFLKEESYSALANRATLEETNVVSSGHCLRTTSVHNHLLKYALCNLGSIHVTYTDDTKLSLKIQNL